MVVRIVGRTLTLAAAACAVAACTGDDGTGAGAFHECDETNNTATILPVCTGLG
jgi:hypothetical protein